jgi:hypothetical protein
MSLFNHSYMQTLTTNIINHIVIDLLIPSVKSLQLIINIIQTNIYNWPNLVN